MIFFLSSTVEESSIVKGTYCTEKKKDNSCCPQESTTCDLLTQVTWKPLILFRTSLDCSPQEDAIEKRYRET